MKLLFAGLLLFLYCGCGGPKPKWTNLAGKYSSEQAFREYGPPDRKETLANGNALYSWSLSQTGHLQTKLLLEFNNKGVLSSGRKVIYYTSGEPHVLED